MLSACPTCWQEAGALCQALPGCAAFAFVPSGLENSTGTRGLPVAIFKNATSSGGVVDMERSSLSLVSSLYVKQGRLLEPSSASSGLSSGAIAGESRQGDRCGEEHKGSAMLGEMKFFV